MPGRDITTLLAEWRRGNRQALEELTPLVYEELRRLANGYMRRERAGHTLQSTALVHEAYLRLLGGVEVEWQNRSHFFGVAAQIVRRVLVDHARAAHTAKRDPGSELLPINEVLVAGVAQPVRLLDIDDALQSLEAVDPRQARVVELRYFAGLNVEETAEVMAISPATVKREWAAAKAWLYRELKGMGTP